MLKANVKGRLRAAGFVGPYVIPAVSEEKSEQYPYSVRALAGDLPWLGQALWDHGTGSRDPGRLLELKQPDRVGLETAQCRAQPFELIGYTSVQTAGRKPASAPLLDGGPLGGARPIK